MITRILLVTAAFLSFVFMPADADARARHRHHQQITRHSVPDILAKVSVGTVELSARRSSGACDGFHRCRCGVTAAANFGIPYSYHGHNLKQAIVWRHTFPRTSFGPGVAGVQAHHVLKVVGGSSCANATVMDETGTYQRNVCNMTFHAVNGGGFSMPTYASAPTRERHATHSSRGKTRYATDRSRGYKQYASAERDQFAYGNLQIH